MLATHAAEVEADLQRWYQVDYRQRWRGDLTLRRLWVLICHLPAESTTWTAVRGAPHWTVEAQLLDDVRIALTTEPGKKGRPHPQRPRRTAAPVQVTAERATRLADARRRSRARRRAREEGKL